MSTHRFTITLPNGNQFHAADEATVIGWAKDSRIPADAVIAESGQPPIVAARHPTIGLLVVPSPDAPANDGGISTIIPYRNAPALAGYYTGVASLIPIIGLLAGPVAIGLGVKGLKNAKANPNAKGKAHAITAIVLGSLATIGNWGCLATGVIATLVNRP